MIMSQENRFQLFAQQQNPSETSRKQRDREAWKVSTGP